MLRIMSLFLLVPYIKYLVLFQQSSIIRFNNDSVREDDNMNTDSLRSHKSCESSLQHLLTFLWLI